MGNFSYVALLFNGALGLLEGVLGVVAISGGKSWARWMYIIGLGLLTGVLGVEAPRHLILGSTLVGGIVGLTADITPAIVVEGFACKQTVI